LIALNITSRIKKKLTLEISGEGDLSRAKFDEAFGELLVLTKAGLENDIIFLAI